MKRSTDRILTTHVGSLVRPPGVVEIMRAKENGHAYDQQELAACVRNSVHTVACCISPYTGCGTRPLTL